MKGHSAPFCICGVLNPRGGSLGAVSCLSEGSLSVCQCPLPPSKHTHTHLPPALLFLSCLSLHVASVSPISTLYFEVSFHLFVWFFAFLLLA